VKANRFIKALGAGLMVLLICAMSVGAAAAADTSKPTKPANLTAASVTTTSVKLTWQKSTDNVGVKSYAIYKDSAYLTYTAKTEAAITNLKPGTSYTFYVAAQDAQGNISAASSKITVTTKSNAASGKIIAGYYASWAAYSGYTPSDIPASKLTHILYAFANINSSNKIALGDPEVDEKNFAELRALKKKYPSLKTLISIGGWEWSGRFSNVASTASRREAFA
jgi:chitinase